jgi:hypothetical protein
MTDMKQAPAPAAAPAMAKRGRRVKDYLVPPLVIPAALSIVILIYMLVRGPL